MSDNYKTIKRFNTSPEANMAKNYLRDNGVMAVINDEHAGEIFSTAVKGVRLEVPLDQVERADLLLSALEKEIPVENGDIAGILEECDCLLTGHFQLTSGLHSDKYIEKIKVIQDPQKVITIAGEFVKRLQDIKPDVVIGMAMGGIALGYEVARQMETRFAFTQRKDGKMTVRKGFDVHKGMKAIVIEDIVTTGGSVKEVLELLNSMEVRTEAVGLIVDRSGGEVDFGVRTEALLTVKVEAHQPGECPLCKQGISLTIPGSSDK